MSKHLSEDQFANCAGGRPGKADLEHVRECSECRAELERFGTTLALFRGAVRQRTDDRVAVHRPEIALLRAPIESHPSRWRWAMVAAAVVALFLPYFVTQKKPQQEIDKPAISETDPNAVMNRVNLHLSRTVPAPMEPIMSLIPIEELASQSGGLQ